MWNDKILRSETYQNFKPRARSSSVSAPKIVNTPPSRDIIKRDFLSTASETLNQTIRQDSFILNSSSSDESQNITIHSDSEEYTVSQRKPFFDRAKHPDLYTTRIPFQTEKESLKPKVTPRSPEMPDDNQNTTLGNLSTVAGSPLLPKYQNPPTFNPLTDNVLTFINEFEQIAEFNNWTNEIKMRLFGTFLRESAHTWYTDYKINRTNAAKTWPDIVKDFKESFNEDEAREQLHDKLDMRKQGINESGLTYYNDVISLIKTVNPTMSTSDKIRILRRGLNEKFTKLYVTHATRKENLLEFNDLLKKFEKIVSLDNDKTPVFTLGNLNNKNYEPLHRSFSRLNTRTHDARPRCFRCNRTGHLMRACQQGPRPVNPFRAPGTNLGRGRPSTPTVRFTGISQNDNRNTRSGSGDRQNFGESYNNFSRRENENNFRGRGRGRYNNRGGQRRGGQSNRRTGQNTLNF